MSCIRTRVRSRALLASGIVLAHLLVSPTLSSRTWVRSLGTDESNLALGLDVNAAGEIFLTGVEGTELTRQDMWIVNLRPDGEVGWIRDVGGYDDFEIGHAVHATDDGGALVAGMRAVQGEGIGGALARVDSAGRVIWARAFDPTGGYGFHGVRATSDGGAVVAGPRMLRLDGNGEVLWSRWYLFAGYGGEVRRLDLLPDGGIIAVADLDVFSGWEVGVLRLDAAGQVVWARVMGQVGGSEGASAVTATPDGGCVLAGKTRFPPDGLEGGWLVKLDAAGDVEWQRAFDLAAPDPLLDIRLTTDGGYIVAGRVDYAGGRTDGWLARLDGDGSALWQRRFPAGSLFGAAEWGGADPGLVAAGWGLSPDGGNWDIWTYGLDPSGWLEEGCDQVLDASVAVADVSVATSDVAVSMQDTSWSAEDIDSRAPGTVERAWYCGACEADAYEEDDSCGPDLPWIQGGETQLHDFCEDSVDWVRFHACAGREYTLTFRWVSRYAGADLTLCRPNCNCFLSEPVRRYSPLTWTADADGDVLVQIKPWDGVQGNDHTYQFTLEGDTSPCAGPPGPVSPPGSIQPLVFTDRATLVWAPAAESRSDTFNLYRGDIETLGNGEHGGCVESGIAQNATATTADPPPSTGWFYLVTGSNGSGEGPMGTTSSWAPRENRSPCP